MEALRNIYTVENNRIIIDLPQNYNHHGFSRLKKACIFIL